MDPAAARHERLRDAALTGLLLLLLLAWDFSGLDLYAARVFGRPEGFPLREAWWSSRLLHEGGRWAAGVALAALVINIWRPWVLPQERAERVRWVLITLACLILVPLLKRMSATSCPWDLQIFGGTALYLPHWQPGTDHGPGRCFPSGHAVAAFAFLGGWFMLRARHPRTARAWLAGVLVAGMLFGIAQVARGAHYPSHLFWSGWLCWTLSALLSQWPRSPPAPAASR